MSKYPFHKTLQVLAHMLFFFVLLSLLLPFHLTPTKRIFIVVVAIYVYLVSLLKEND